MGGPASPRRRRSPRASGWSATPCGWPRATAGRPTCNPSRPRTLRSTNRGRRGNPHPSPGPPPKRPAAARWSRAAPQAAALVVDGRKQGDWLHGLLAFTIPAGHRLAFDPMEQAIGAAGQQGLAGTEHLRGNWRRVDDDPLSPELLAIPRVGQRWPADWPTGRLADTSVFCRAQARPAALRQGHVGPWPGAGYRPAAGAARAAGGACRCAAGGPGRCRLEPAGVRSCPAGVFADAPTRASRATMLNASSLPGGASLQRRPP